MRTNKTLLDKQAARRPVHFHPNLLRQRVHKYGNVHSPFLCHWLQILGPHPNDTLLEASSAATRARRLRNTCCLYGEWHTCWEKDERYWDGDNLRLSRSAANTQFIAIEEAQAQEMAASQYHRVLLLQRQRVAWCDRGRDPLDLFNIHKHSKQCSQVAPKNLPYTSLGCLRGLIETLTSGNYASDSSRFDYSPDVTLLGEWISRKTWPRRWRLPRKDGAGKCQLYQPRWWC